MEDKMSINGSETNWPGHGEDDDEWCDADHDTDQWRREHPQSDEYEKRKITLKALNEEKTTR